MIETTPAIAENPRTSTAAKIGWAMLIAATLYVCYFSHLGAIGFVGPDEPRYAWIARDMAETGDWVTPRLYGKPWFEKPPLFYWGAAVCFKLFGVSEAAARLPSAISALLATLAMAWLGMRLYGAETARWLLLLLSTTVGMIGFSHAAATDMPFSGMLTIAMVCAAVVLGLTSNEHTPILPRTPWLALLLFGFFLGLAVLAKGPAAIILSGGAVFFWALFTKRWRDVLRLFHPAAIAAFCLTALPWYILCARRNPDFFRIFIIEHNFKRYLTPEFQHIQPFWYYALVLLLAFLPWTGVLVWTALAGGMRIVSFKKLGPSAAFLFSWSVFVVFFFTISKSKLPGYVLPAVPALALLVACSFGNLPSEHNKSFGASIAAFALLFLVAAHVAPRLLLHSNIPSRQVLLMLSFVFGMVSMANAILAAAFLLSRGRWELSLMPLICVIPVLFAVVMAGQFAARLVSLSSRDLAVQLVSQHVSPDSTFVYRGMGRGPRYALNFYLRKELPDWDQNPNADAYVVSGSVNCEHLQKQEFNCADVPLGPSAAGWFVSRITPKNLPGMLPDGRQPH